VYTNGSPQREPFCITGHRCFMDRFVMVSLATLLQNDAVVRCVTKVQSELTSGGIER
jgi:hypothetical protein